MNDASEAVPLGQKKDAYLIDAGRTARGRRARTGRIAHDDQRPLSFAEVHPKNMSEVSREDRTRRQESGQATVRKRCQKLCEQRPKHRNTAQFQ